MPRRSPMVLFAAIATICASACGSSSAPITFDDTLAPDTTPIIEVLPVSSAFPSVPSSSENAEASSPSTETPLDSSVPGVPPSGLQPPPASPTTTEESSNQSSLFPYPTLYEVPQLGEDPVRGSGCGLADGFGDDIPDGLWYGLIHAGSRVSTLGFDVVCAYYGDSALQVGALPGLEQVLYPVNSNTRIRQIDLADDFAWRAGENRPGLGCADPGPVADQPETTLPSGTASWVLVSGGEATLAITFCV